MKRNLTVFLFSFIAITLLPLCSQSQWVELNTGVSVRINSISSIKQVTTWACGVSGTVIKSSNSGDNWENGNLDGIGPAINLNHIYALTPAIVFAAGNNG